MYDLCYANRLYFLTLINCYPITGLMEPRRRTLGWLPTMMLWTLPTKSGLSKQPYFHFCAFMLFFLLVEPEVCFFLLVGPKALWILCKIKYCFILYEQHRWGLYISLVCLVGCFIFCIVISKLECRSNWESMNQLHRIITLKCS